VPSALATVSMVFGVYWAVLLLMGVRDESRSHALVGRFGVALALVGLTDAVGQTLRGRDEVRAPERPAAGVARADHEPGADHPPLRARARRPPGGEEARACGCWRAAAARSSQSVKREVAYSQVTRHAVSAST
jgi:hypothetical protein